MEITKVDSISLGKELDWEQHQKLLSSGEPPQIMRSLSTILLHLKRSNQIDELNKEEKSNEMDESLWKGDVEELGIAGAFLVSIGTETLLEAWKDVEATKKLGASKDSYMALDAIVSIFIHLFRNLKKSEFHSQLTSAGSQIIKIRSQEIVGAILNKSYAGRASLHIDLLSSMAAFSANLVLLVIQNINFDVLTRQMREICVSSHVRSSLLHLISAMVEQGEGHADVISGLVERRIFISKVVGKLEHGDEEEGIGRFVDAVTRTFMSQDVALQAAISSKQRLLFFNGFLLEHLLKLSGSVSSEECSGRIFGLLLAICCNSRLGIAFSVFSDTSVRSLSKHSFRNESLLKLLQRIDVTLSHHRVLLFSTISHNPHLLVPFLREFRFDVEKKWSFTRLTSSLFVLGELQRRKETLSWIRSCDPGILLEPGIQDFIVEYHAFSCLTRQKIVKLVSHKSPLIKYLVLKYIYESWRSFSVLANDIRDQGPSDNTIGGESVLLSRIKNNFTDFQTVLAMVPSGDKKDERIEKEPLCMIMLFKALTSISSLALESLAVQGPSLSDFQRCVAVLFSIYDRGLVLGNTGQNGLNESNCVTISLLRFLRVIACTLPEEDVISIFSPAQKSGRGKSKAASRLFSIFSRLIEVEYELGLLRFKGGIPESREECVSGILLHRTGLFDFPYGASSADIWINSISCTEDAEVLIVLVEHSMGVFEHGMNSEFWETSDNVCLGPLADALLRPLTSTENKGKSGQTYVSKVLYSLICRYTMLSDEIAVQGTLLSSELLKYLKSERTKLMTYDIRETITCFSFPQNKNDVMRRVPVFLVSGFEKISFSTDALLSDESLSVLDELTILAEKARGQYSVLVELLVYVRLHSSSMRKSKIKKMISSSFKMIVTLVCLVYRCWNRAFEYNETPAQAYLDLLTSCGDCGGRDWVKLASTGDDVDHIFRFLSIFDKKSNLPLEVLNSLDVSNMNWKVIVSIFLHSPEETLFPLIIAPHVASMLLKVALCESGDEVIDLLDRLNSQFNRGVLSLPTSKLRLDFCVATSSENESLDFSRLRLLQQLQLLLPRSNFASLNPSFLELRLGGSHPRLRKHGEDSIRLEDYWRLVRESEVPVELAIDVGESVQLAVVRTGDHRMLKAQVFALLALLHRCMLAPGYPTGEMALQNLPLELRLINLITRKVSLIPSDEESRGAWQEELDDDTAPTVMKTFVLFLKHHLVDDSLLSIEIVDIVSRIIPLACMKPATLLRRVIAHSLFTEGMNAHASKQRTSLCKLLATLVRRAVTNEGEDESAILHSESIYKLLSAFYFGTTSLDDMYLLHVLLMLQRSRNVSHGFLFGTAATEYAIARAKGKAISGDTALNLMRSFFSIFPEARERFRPEGFPTKLQYEVDTSRLLPIEETVAMESAQAQGDTKRISYDPRFVLPILLRVLHGGCSPNDLLTSGALSWTVMGMASTCPEIRQRAYAVVATTHAGIEKTSKQVSTLLTALKNAVQEPFERIPMAVASFVAHSIPILLRPQHDLYVSINGFILARPTIDLSDIPLHFSFFHAEDNIPQKYSFIARIIFSGCETLSDLELLKKRHVFELVMTKCIAPFSEEGRVRSDFRSAIGGVLKTFSAFASSSTSTNVSYTNASISEGHIPALTHLIRNCGLLSWIYEVFSTYNGIIWIQLACIRLLERITKHASRSRYGEVLHRNTAVGWRDLLHIDEITGRILHSLAGEGSGPGKKARTWISNVDILDALTSLCSTVDEVMLGHKSIQRRSVLFRETTAVDILCTSALRRALKELDEGLPPRNLKFLCRALSSGVWMVQYDRTILVITAFLLRRLLVNGEVELLRTCKNLLRWHSVIVSAPVMRNVECDQVALDIARGFADYAVLLLSALPALYEPFNTEIFTYISAAALSSVILLDTQIQGEESQERRERRIKIESFLEEYMRLPEEQRGDEALEYALSCTIAVEILGVRDKEDNYR